MSFSFDKSVEKYNQIREESQEDSCLSNYINYLQTFQKNFNLNDISKPGDVSDS